MWKGPGNAEREWGAWYMTNTASWAVLPALCGFAWNAIDGAMTLAPQIPASLGCLQRIPLFMPGFHALVDADAQGATLTITELIDSAALRLATLNTPRDATVLVNDTPVPTHGVATADGRTQYRIDVALHVGDRLKLRWHG